MYTVVFKSIENNSSVSINLHSHYTCLYGEYSGEGKSHFFSSIEQGVNTDTIKVEVSDPNIGFTLATAATLEAILGNESKMVIMIDESSMLKESIIKKVNTSKHIFICITRSMPFKMDYPLQGLYKVSRKVSGDIVSFDIDNLNSLPIAKDFNNRYDDIIVEASEGRSESQLLGVYLDGIKSSGGRDRIEKLLRKSENKKVLVFADLGNIGRAYKLLFKRCKENPNIRFYGYQCFEQLLYRSPLVGELPDNTGHISKFDVVSLENYYESLMEERTRGTKLEYKHGKSLKAEFLDKRNFLKVFTSKVGKGIGQYIKIFGSLK